MLRKNKKDDMKNSKPVEKETVVEIVKNHHKESSFSVFQIIIFSFLFVLMIWIIAFLSLEVDGQKQQIQTLNHKIDKMEKGGVELLESYIEKIRDLQRVDIKDQVQQFGLDIKDSITRVRELMFDKNDLAKLEGKIKSLEEYNNTYRGTNLLMLTSTTLLRDAINRGEAFKNELDTLVFVGGKNQVVQDAEANLRPFADKGIKTFTQIKNDFDKLADDIVFMAYNPKGEGDNVRDRFVFRVKSLFKIRKIDLDKKEDEEITPDYIVAKTQDYLMKEDLQNALNEFAKLEQSFKGGFDFAKKWYDDAKLKLSINETIAPLMKFSLEKALHDVEIKKPKIEKIVLTPSTKTLEVK